MMPRTCAKPRTLPSDSFEGVASLCQARGAGGAGGFVASSLEQPAKRRAAAKRGRRKHVLMGGRIVEPSEAKLRRIQRNAKDAAFRAYGCRKAPPPRHRQRRSSAGRTS